MEEILISQGIKIEAEVELAWTCVGKEAIGAKAIVR